ncbi:PucR family transcriptional regulator [Nocardioides sp. Arc9.136]|uniref:helix-turn-helix domain-containing protein n=1 Tax=Nocardioides sp. Arc9.136 TaxID=2996826 RepID=UPI0026670E73|nr:PucR family transcriptional regulator [Nocardioides sp. Arc9.136]WKN48673.1 PucR family transcriptional regulator ligand-binding domain-containing protein [Nocardioides sp. Arc9.136]
MALPTVASLCSTLGHHLSPAPGFSPPDTEITAVHISELLDPAAYLAGGELLLTTGLGLPEDEAACRAYVERLVAAETSALALGLGPVHADPPARLAAACRALGLVLLVVPAPTPFLTVSTAYWAARSRSTEQQLTDAVAAHRALVDAAVAPDPAAAILRRLARLLGGWAAVLGPSGEVDQVHPPSMQEDAEALQAEVTRLEMAGVHSSASLSIAGSVVVVFPLAVQDRVVGYLAAGAPDQVHPWQRRVILTAAALLSLDVLRNQRTESAREATRRCVALLVDAGLVDAARRLAAEAGAPSPGRELRVVVARGRDSEGLVQAVERWCPDALAVAVDRSIAWFLVPDDHPDPGALEKRLRDVDRSVAAAMSDLVAAEAAGPTRARLLQVVASMPGATVALPRSAAPGALLGALDVFLATAAGEVRGALVAYLRHRGQWEQASRELGLHRNTLRYRVQRARAHLAVDLDDPDVAAELWLALRARGVA